QAQAQAYDYAAQREGIAAQALVGVMNSIDQLVTPGVTNEYMAQLAYSNPEEFRALQARVDLVRQFKGQVQQMVQGLIGSADQQKQQAQQVQQQAAYEVLSAELNKMQGYKWFNKDFEQKTLAYARKHGIPQEAVSGIQYAGAFEVFRKAMLYDEAVARGKAGKQPKNSPMVTSNARPGQGQMSKQKRSAELLSRAHKGEKGALGAWFLDNS
ncbi:MAG: hypothetical protein ACRCWJ_09305, partial [Casimicrobium sp.]